MDKRRDAGGHPCGPTTLRDASWATTPPSGATASCFATTLPSHFLRSSNHAGSSGEYAVESVVRRGLEKRRSRLACLFIRNHPYPQSLASLAMPHVLTCTSTAHEGCRSSMSWRCSVRVSTTNSTSTTTHRTTTTTCPPLTHSAEHHQGTPHRRLSALHTASFDLQEPAVTRGDWQAALAPYQHSQPPPNTPTGTPPTHPPTTLSATPPNTTAPGTRGQRPGSSPGR